MTPNFVSDQLARLSTWLAMRAGSRPQALFPARSVVLENINLVPTLALIVPLENSPSQVRVRVYYRLSLENTRLGQTGADTYTNCAPYAAGGTHANYSLIVWS